MKYNDDGLMTPEKGIKLRGHEIMMKLNSVGVPWDKCNLAALVVALELKAQFKNIFNGPEAERIKRLDQFDKLEEGIKGFLPMPKEEILSRFTEEIERAYSEAVEKAINEADTIHEFKEKVLNIIRNPKTKFKLFV